MPFDEVLVEGDGLVVFCGEAAADQVDLFRIEAGPEVAGADVFDFELDTTSFELGAQTWPDAAEELDGELGGADGDGGADAASGVVKPVVPAP